MMDLSKYRTWAELKLRYQAVQWIIPDWLPKGYVTMLAADPGVGKSLMALVVCRAILQGGKILGYDMPAPPVGTMPRILWVEAEAGEPFHMERAANLGINPLQMIEPRTSSEESTTPSLANSADREAITAILHHDHVAMCVIDSLSAATSGTDENSSQAGTHMKWLSELARNTSKPILVIHHMNKSGLRTRGSSAPSMADIRGTSAILQHARMIWTLDNPHDDQPAVLRIACAKSNLGVKPEPMYLQHHRGDIIPYTTNQPSVGFGYGMSIGVEK